MITRVLPPDEWPRLVGTELETIWPVLDPQTSRVLVIEDGSQIIGCWAGFPLFHAEGVYVAPDHRGKGSVARALIAGMRELATEAGYRSVVTASIDPIVGRMLTRLGAVTLTGTHYALPLTQIVEGEKCLQP